MRVSWVCFAVGRTDGNLPLVTEKHIPVRNMALQYNFVFDRAGGLAQLNNLSWPQWVNTIIPPKGGRTRERHLSSIARAGQLQAIQTRN